MLTPNPPKTEGPLPLGEKPEAGLEAAPRPRPVQTLEGATGRPALTVPLGKHVAALDGIRGLAIGLVLVLHFIGNTQPHSVFEKVLVKAATFGTYGVALFFVLSGFLITGILIDSKGQPAYFRNFYARRTLRIFPLYYGVLFVGLWLWPRAWSPADLEIARERQAWLWGYAANFLIAKEQSWDALPYFNHFWSLAVEEHFYFLWPLLVARSSARGLLRWACGLILMAVTLRVFLAASGTSDLVAYTITPAKLDGLCFGGLIAIWIRRPEGLVQLKAWAPWVTAAVIGYVVVGHLLTHSIWPSAHAVYFEGRETGVLLLFGVLLVSVLTAPPRAALARLFTSRLMVTLGKYSYGLYVFHAILSWHFLRNRTEDAVTELVGSHTLAVFLQATGGIAISFALAFASFHLFEKRFLVLKSRFEAKPREVVAKP